MLGESCWKWWLIVLVLPLEWGADGCGWHGCLWSGAWTCVDTWRSVGTVGFSVCNWTLKLSRWVFRKIEWMEVVFTVYLSAPDQLLPNVSSLNLFRSLMVRLLSATVAASHCDYSNAHIRGTWVPSVFSGKCKNICKLWSSGNNEHRVKSEQSSNPPTFRHLLWACCLIDNRTWPCPQHSLSYHYSQTCGTNYSNVEPI